MKYDLDSESEKPCWLSKYDCPCRTAACYSAGLPDMGCPVYDWFKQVVEWNKEHKPEEA